MFSSSSKRAVGRGAQRISGRSSEEGNGPKRYLICNKNSICFHVVDMPQYQDKKQVSFVDDNVEDINSTEEDERAVAQAIWLEQLKKTIIDIQIDS